MRFLVIDDSAADRELIVRRLRKEAAFSNAEFIEVGRPDQLKQVLERDGFDFVLTDYQLHWTNGLQIFSKMKAQYPDIPVVMVTGTGSEEIAVEGLRAGLSNYVLKKHLDRLPLAIYETLEKLRLRTQYEEAIQQLRASEERYRELFEQALTGVFVISPEGAFIACNLAFVRIFAFSSPEEVLTTNFASLYSQATDFTAFIERIRREKRIEYQELAMSRYDGVAVYVVANVAGTFDKDGTLTQINGYLFDNTEQRKLTQQLQQSQKLESIGLLVSGIAHDFNNMLGGIVGYAGRGMAKMPKSHPLYENFFRIQEIASRATKITQQLLAFSRRQVLEPSDIDLNAVIENLLELLGKVLVDTIEITFLPDPALKSVHVDYSQIEQVLMNLCINARDAMPHGGNLLIKTRMVSLDEVRIIGHKEAQAAEYIQLLVQDTGTGMTEQVRAKIFEPFFTTKELGKGTGLGLSMVHGIIGQHSGFIDVESEPGAGSTFKLYLPANTNVSSHVALNDKTPHTIEGGTETILVVEDDPDLRYLMQEVLEDYGYTVMTACDGLEGLQLYEQYGTSISLIISDLMTPKMVGKEMYERIQRLSSSAKFLFVSGYQANQVSQNFVLDKGIEFLQKPFDLDDLATKVHTILA